MAEDTDKNNGGIGAGTIATGVGAGVGAAALTGWVAGNDSAVKNTQTKLSEAQEALATTTAENKPARDLAENKVRGTREGQKLFGDQSSAELKLNMAKSAAKQAEATALAEWQTNGSPEAIAAHKAKVDSNPVEAQKILDDSKAQARKYIATSDAIKADEAKLSNLVNTLKPEYEKNAVAFLNSEVSEEKGKFLKEFVAQNPDLLKGSGSVENQLTEAKIKDFMKWQEESVDHVRSGNATAASIEEQKGKILKQLDIQDLPKSDQKIILTQLENFSTNHNNIVAANDINAHVNQKISEVTKPLDDQIAARKAVLTELEPAKTAAVKPAMDKANGEVAAAERSAKEAKAAVDSAVGKHAGKEVAAINSAESNVQKLTKRMDAIKGEGNVIEKSMKGVKSRPGLVFAVGSVALAAVVAAKQLFWRDKVSQERASAPQQDQAASAARA